MNYSIPAAWMRGGTSKGLFFLEQNLPSDHQERDELLLAAIGSPDPYGKQIDGVGGATSSTSKIVILSKSDQPGCDVDYLFGHVAIDRPLIDYSGNCGNLSAAVGIFAVESGLVDIKVPVTEVSVWQKNLGQKMKVLIPTSNGQVDLVGNYYLSGVTKPSPCIMVEFYDPGNGAVLPTGNVIDTLSIPEMGNLDVSLVRAGNDTVFVEASSLALLGAELPDVLNTNQALLEVIEIIRQQAAVAIGAVNTVEQAGQQPATPKVAIVSKSQSYDSSSGLKVSTQDIDLCARIFSMGKAHHAFTGTGAIATAVAANIPGTLVERACNRQCSGLIRLGHPGGSLDVSAEVEYVSGNYHCLKASLPRTARTLMRGEVFVTVDK